MVNPIRKLLKMILRNGQKQGINTKEALSIEDAQEYIGQAIEAKVRADTTIIEHNRHLMCKKY